MRSYLLTLRDRGIGGMLGHGLDFLYRMHRVGYIAVREGWGWMEGVGRRISIVVAILRSESISKQCLACLPSVHYSLIIRPRSLWSIHIQSPSGDNITNSSIRLPSTDSAVSSLHHDQPFNHVLLLWWKTEYLPQLIEKNDRAVKPWLKCPLLE